MASATQTQPDLLTLQTIYLCGVSYLADPALMPGLIEKTQKPSDQGSWRCLWGPALDDDEANLVFVAGYFPDSNPAPQSIVITVRGTDVDISDIWGIFEQIWEDLDAADPQPMPWAKNDPARIASGTLDGLDVIKGLTSGGLPLGVYLTTFLQDPANANVTTVVTGHSLGGCLATVVAMWIRTLTSKYSGPIQPVTFAAPTAGNADFVTYYDKLFPGARRFQNTLDVIPLAFYDLDEIDGIYDDDFLETPDPVWLGIAGMEVALDITGATYAQPTNGQQILTGTFSPDDATDWYGQALHQHHLATYLALLTGGTVDTAALPQQSVVHAKKARLTKRIGSPRQALNKLTPKTSS